MMTSRITLSALYATCALLLAFVPAGCDSDNDGDGAPATNCSVSYSVANDTGGDFGEACTSGSDCKYGACLMPGATGNISNNQFGFCTRGCDCGNNDDTALSLDEKRHLSCFYPQSPAQHHRHVVTQCSTVSDCTDLAAGWTDCRIPDYGSARKICYAE